MEFKIGKVRFSNNRTVIIAEAGVNHLGRMDLAEKLIKAAAQAGADIIKFQTYKAHKLTTKKAPRFWSWDGERKKKGSQYDSYSNLDSFDIDDYYNLKKICKNYKIEFMSTPFDLESVDILESLNVGGYKIASCDITNFPLLKYVAKTKKPILLSTGASQLQEIKNAVKVLEENGAKNIVIMQCVLCYPTQVKDANLSVVSSLKETFPKNIIGLSDHTLGIKLAAGSVLLGVRVIEKHFTFDKNLPDSADHWLSINEEELEQLVKEVRFFESALGKTKKVLLNCEKRAFKYARRSLVAKYQILKGEKITIKKIDFKRPGTGISPNQLDKVLNKVAKKNLKEDQILKFSDLEK